MSKLSKRLSVIAKLVNKKRVCDVGCDHGKLAEYLLENKIVDYMVVSDISQPSLNKAIELLSNKNFNFEHICCNGLTGYIDKKIDQAVISGMGGDEIIDIITNNPIIINSFILSPQHNIKPVKHFMLDNGYKIDYDIIISDKGKFYNIFRCVKSKDKCEYTDFNLVIGKENFTDNESAIDEFVKFEINKINNILNTHKVVNAELIDYLELLKEYYKRI